MVGLEIDSQIFPSLLLTDVWQFFKMKPVNDFCFSCIFRDTSILVSIYCYLV